MEDLGKRTEFDGKVDNKPEWKQAAPNDKLRMEVNFKRINQDDKNALSYISYCKIYLGDKISKDSKYVKPYLESPPLHIRKSGILFFWTYFRMVSSKVNKQNLNYHFL